jgi:acetyl esterase/lipase
MSWTDRDEMSRQASRGGRFTLLLAWGTGLAALFLITLLIASQLYSPVGVALRTALVMPDMFAFQPYRPIVPVSRDPVVSEVVIPDRPLTAILYSPGGAPPHGALVLTLGVHPVPPDDPSVVRLADGLARAGVAVLVVQSDDLVADRILPIEVDNLVAAFKFAQQHPDIDSKRVGMFGFSAGASLAALAVADERIRDDVVLLGWFGGFADISDMIVAITTRSYVPLEPGDVQRDPPRIVSLRPAGERQEWQPDQLSQYIFVKQLIDALPETSDRERLTNIFVPVPGVPIDPRTLPGQPPPELSPGGKSVYRLLVTSDVPQVEKSIEELPSEIKRQFASLSPIEAIDGIRAPTFIMHDQSDHLVPFSQSVKFAAALPPTTPAHLTIFNLFEHVRPTRALSPFDFAGDVYRLYRAIYQIILLIEE